MRPTAVRNLFTLLVVLTVIPVVAVTAFRDAPPSSPHTAQQPDTTREAPTAAAPDREELLKVAAEVMEGKRPRSDLDMYGISLGKTTGGDAAKAMLLEELRRNAATRPAP